MKRKRNEKRKNELRNVDLQKKIQKKAEFFSLEPIISFSKTF